LVIYKDCNKMHGQQSTKNIKPQNKSMINSMVIIIIIIIIRRRITRIKTSHSLTTLNLHPNTYIQLQESVILGTCSIARNFLNYK